MRDSRVIVGQAGDDPTDGRLYDRYYQLTATGLYLNSTIPSQNFNKIITEPRKIFFAKNDPPGGI
jgi:hypothetical protein